MNHTSFTTTLKLRSTRKLRMTRKLLSLLLVTSALFVVGCGKKKNKAAQIQKEAVAKQFVEQERAANKEDYSVAA